MKPSAYFLLSVARNATDIIIIIIIIIIIHTVNTKKKKQQNTQTRTHAHTHTHTHTHTHIHSQSMRGCFYCFEVQLHDGVDVDDTVGSDGGQGWRSHAKQ